MPIYEYECRKCGKRFEHLQRTAGDKPARCPACAGRKIVKVFSAFSVAAAHAHEHAPSPKCNECPSGSCPYSRR